MVVGGHQWEGTGYTDLRCERVGRKVVLVVHRNDVCVGL